MGRIRVERDIDHLIRTTSYHIELSINGIKKLTKLQRLTETDCQSWAAQN